MEKKLTEYFEILDRKLLEAKNILITTHKNPDIDGVAAELAMADYLVNNDKKLTIINTGTPATVLQYFHIHQEIHHVDECTEIPLNTFDLILVFDTNELQRTGLFCQDKDRVHSFLICIDHHEGNCKDFNFTIQNEKKSSTSEIIYIFLTSRNYYISKNLAEILYAGICVDTGLFQYSRTSPTTFRIAAELCEKGAEPAKISEILRQKKSEMEVRLLGNILKNFKVEHDGRIVYACMNKDQFNTGAKLGIDFGEFCDRLLDIRNVECALIFKEVTNNFLRINLRSKHKIDVAAFAKQLGSGGGHRHAANLRIKMRLREAVSYVIENLKAYSIWD